MNSQQGAYIAQALNPCPAAALNPKHCKPAPCVDYLVNNAGVANVCWFEEVPDVADLKQVLAVNFWGAVHPTHCALPHLKKNGGKIVFANSSAAAVLAMPRMSLYNASKAAVLNFLETLRMELGDEVGITIATPGWIESEMTKGKHLSKTKEGTVEVDQDTRDASCDRGPPAIVDWASPIRVRIKGPTEPLGLVWD
ncbi:11-beta-hydroxysteroid dehydrogenase 1A-like [Miscanthus floridulus]|uniref:11-beta-hydroxysteroid dehydrogenase 1A-like n=1 Tax=Miscanthus floridulus TaxID=154761 RepID=UPI00345A7E73